MPHHSVAEARKTCAVRADDPARRTRREWVSQLVRDPPVKRMRHDAHLQVAQLSTERVNNVVAVFRHQALQAAPVPAVRRRALQRRRRRRRDL